MLAGVTVELPVVRDAPDADPYVIAGWDGRAERRGLPRRTLSAARIVAEALFSRDGGPAPAERLDYLERELDDFFGHVSARARLLFRACIATLFWIAPLLLGRMSSLKGLGIAERVEALERLERTPLSLALLAAKAALSLIWYEHPESAREIGWDQRCKGPPE